MSNRQRKASATEGKAKSGQRRNGAPKRRKPGGSDASFAAALRSFLGHLEGTAKAKHTVDSYRFDLQNFDQFLHTQKHGAGIANVRTLTRKDLERFGDWLKLDGQKTNTRRRKLMTVRKFMQYLAGRKKLDLDVGRKLPAPEKVERVPFTLDATALREAVLGLPGDSHLRLRNSILLLVLLETGASVSEVAQLRWSMIDSENSLVRFLGKSEREISISRELVERFAKLRKFAADTDDLCFVGFNRFGPVRLGKKSLGITPRGVEMLVKALCATLGHSETTPRTLRHSAVVAWFRAGVSENEIQKRLGLKTAYTFRIYQPIFAAIRNGSKSKSETTSIS
jgi:site-specific recombinase XerD